MLLPGASNVHIYTCSEWVKSYSLYLILIVVINSFCLDLVYTVIFDFKAEDRNSIQISRSLNYVNIRPNVHETCGDSNNISLTAFTNVSIYFRLISA